MFSANLQLENSAVMKKRLFSGGILFLIGFINPCYSQLTVYKYINSSSINVTASSTYSTGCPPENLINESGLDGFLHDNDMSAYTMWHSEEAPEISSAFPGTLWGKVWLSFEFDRIYPVKEIWIWNHNQPEFTARGLNKIYIQYSDDGRKWDLLKNDEHEFWSVPEANAANGLLKSMIIDCKGLMAKYVVMTADKEDGNYGSDIYGLSEVKFITTITVPVLEAIKLEGTDRVLQGTVSQRLCNLYFQQGIVYGDDEIIIEYLRNKDTVQFKAYPEPIGIVPVYLSIPFDNDNNIRVIIRNADRTFEKPFIIPPPRKWTVYLIPQSHVDIGYTDIKDKVLEFHKNNIDYAIKLARETKNYPEGSRFRWNVEVLWPVEEYLNDNNVWKRNRFIMAVKKGWINLDGSYSSINTSISNSEQLLHLFEYGQYLRDKYKLPVSSAQQVDLPGMSWGIVPAMNQTEMKYMMNMPNVMEDKSLENYPFYWISPSGKSSILHFQTYYYNLGYHLKGRYIPNYLTGLEEPFYAKNPETMFLDPFIFKYLDDIKKNGYTYNIIPFAWTMTDNAPLDPDLPGVVKKWNEKYVNPSVKISSVSDFFIDFEKAYKDVIPSLTGDYNEYWTNGVASGARETGINRNNTEKILQLETLYALINPEKFAHGYFTKIWRKILLFTEHTWGSYKSVTHPDDPDVKKQWDIKRNYAYEAENELNILLDQVSAEEKNFHQNNNTIDVFNTNSWTRSDIVYIPEKLSSAGDYVTDEKGKQILSQRITSGELAILTDSIPAYRKQTFSIEDKIAEKREGIEINNEIIENQYYIIQITEDKDFILKHKVTGLVIKDFLKAYCQYISGSGELTDTLFGAVKSIVIKESGPLVGSYQVEFSASGCNYLSLEIRLGYNKNYVELINNVDKKSVRTKEIMSFNFPLYIRDSRVLYEIPWGVVNPETDLLPGSHNDFYTIQHFIDVSNQEKGYTMVSLDAPLVKIHKQKTGDGNYINLESIVMDNQWHTNFPASQEGSMYFRYRLRVHESFDLFETAKFGTEYFQPLLPLVHHPLDGDFPVIGIQGDGIMVTSLKPLKTGHGYVMRLFNISRKEGTLKLKLFPGYELWESNFSEKKIAKSDADINLIPFEVRTLIFEN